MRHRVLVVAVVAVACNGTPARGQEQQRSDDALRVPPGFKVGVFAEHLQGVRYMTLGPGNAIYASQPGSGLIVKLTRRRQRGDGRERVERPLRHRFPRRHDVRR